MEYSNPELPEGINASQEHPLKEFFWLSASLLGAIAVVLVVLILVVDIFAIRIPFQVEQRLIGERFSENSDYPELTAYLNTLARRIAVAEELPEGISIRLHYVDDDTVNAFATLGGNVVMFRGLLEKLANENALAMVMAHEIAHIKNRDPIRGMSRGIVIGLALTMVSDAAGNALIDMALSQGATLTILKYSRDQEQAADDTAIDAVLSLYKTTRGADQLFDVLQREHAGKEGSAFFSSHPLTSRRIEHVREMDGKKSEVEVTPLPKDFLQWLDVKGKPKDVALDQDQKKVLSFEKKI